MAGGYKVYYYRTFEDYKKGNSLSLHDNNPKGQKLLKGEVTQSVSDIWTFDFSIAINHLYYNEISPMTGFVEVINNFDNKQEFFGRVLSTKSAMQNNTFSRNFICESPLAFLHDSVQIFQKLPTNVGVKGCLEAIISIHNRNVEEYKRFEIGEVNVQFKTDAPYQYLGYDSTFDTLKNHFLDKIGGYFRIREINNKFILDYLSSIGRDDNTPIEVAKNMKEAQKELAFDDIVTRIVPIGADLDQNSDNKDEETGQYMTRECVTISSVNNGKNYIDDNELIKEFGIIGKKIEWTDITVPSILKKRAEQYLRDQKIAIASWSISVVERSLIDSNYNKFEIGNTHVIKNPPISGIEKLQIVKKKIDILKPQIVALSIGSESQSLSIYQNQQRQAQKSIEKVLADNEASRKASEKRLEAAQKELEKSTEEMRKHLSEQIEKVKSSTSISYLKDFAKQQNTLKEAEQKNYNSLKSEKTRLESESERNDFAIALIDAQIENSALKIEAYQSSLDEIYAKIANLQGGN